MKPKPTSTPFPLLPAHRHKSVVIRFRTLGVTETGLDEIGNQWEEIRILRGPVNTIRSEPSRDSFRRMAQ